MSKHPFDTRRRALAPIPVAPPPSEMLAPPPPKKKPRPRTPPTSEVHAITTTNASYGEPGQTQAKFPLKEAQTPHVPTGLVFTPPEPGEPSASVRIHTLLKHSYSLYYGSGTWDKIPISVETLVDIQITTANTPTAIQEAQDALANHVSNTASELLVIETESTADVVAGMFPDLFDRTPEDEGGR